MQTWEIYLVTDGCDTEWHYLGTIQADSLDEALVTVGYPPEILVCIPVVEQQKVA